MGNFGASNAIGDIKVGSVPEPPVKITLTDGTIYHNGKVCSVYLQRNSITVGCSSITIEAFFHILKHWNKNFDSDKVVVLQP